MPYNNWNACPRARRMAWVPWYNLADLLPALGSMVGRPFPVQAERDQMLATLNAVTALCPFDENTRFPENADYICQTHADWGRQLQQLRSALSYRQNLRGGPEAGEAQRLNDALTAFHNSLQRIQNELVAGNAVFNRATFESHTGLIWA